ncbi:RagB/SusD family nutrient uptake outer membrane protein [Bacteroides fluxus]|uniref:RagB/SusD family nutrient uptake outer membrane protein n=1 Tax=Bacteroides fluxus TaxID=626930 RepID=UPI0023F396C0|nr:RagB/SusD family nutrient uptake outer membrane protein [Bacteroides fluxus]
MKVNKYIYLLFGLLLTSCNDSFLERYPDTELSDKTYFKTEKDLELYTNTFYNDLPYYYLDYATDNASIYSEPTEIVNMMHGGITPSSVEGWDNWGKLRKYNVLLENVHKTIGNSDNINNYIGIARLMRAQWYYDMVKRYNEVPWYSTSIKDTDVDLLYKKKDSRELVVDSVFADLEYAAKNISTEMKNRTVINKWYAYGLLARIALHEASFRKYHDELKLETSAAAYYEKAIKACEKIMESQLFSIDKTGGPDQAYENLFANNNLSTSPEIILFKDFDDKQNIKHDASRRVFSYVSSLSRSLMENYEYIENGKAIPFTSVPNYDKMSMTETFKNRDPRYKQTFMYPGYIRPGENKPFVPNLYLGGYPQTKFVAKTADQMDWIRSYNDIPILRYAEVLFIYAEAKAELGLLTQVDLDATVNLVRERVGMPAILLTSLELNKNLEKQYPNVTGSQKNILLEIRRERRIEFACEYFRYDDLMRWKAGKLLEEIQQGVYIDKFGLHDFTGDGIADIGIFESEATNTVPENERSKYVFYYMKEKSGSQTAICLSEKDHGYIMASTEVNSATRKFEEPKYYYFPIPKTQFTINENLTQTIFW